MATVTLHGMPIVSMGMKAPWAPALFALSGPATPRISPCPKDLGSLAIFFSMAYERKDAISPPPPGTRPKKKPRMALRVIGLEESFQSFLDGRILVILVSNTSRVSADF